MVSRVPTAPLQNDTVVDMGNTNLYSVGDEIQEDPFELVVSSCQV